MQPIRAPHRVARDLLSRGHFSRESLDDPLLCMTTPFSKIEVHADYQGGWNQCWSNNKKNKHHPQSPGTCDEHRQNPTWERPIYNII